MIKKNPLNLSETNNRWNDAIKTIPGGCQTFSKAPFQHVEGVAPKLLKRGFGSHVWDYDENEYIDYMMGLGPVILGHANRSVNDAVFESISNGNCLSLASGLEAILSQKLIELVPCAEKVRFGKNGTDVTSAAVRLARHVTKRDKIAICGYHGWQDWSIGASSMDAGVPSCTGKLTYKFSYNKIETLEKVISNSGHEFAAIIMEPTVFESPGPTFLQDVRELADQNGIILIFDEIITGFRFGVGGAQEKFGVIPDLATFGKSMANGFPISALVGKKTLMDQFESVFFSGTFFGETSAIAASLATIRILLQEKVAERIELFGKSLKNGLRETISRLAIDDIVEVIGHDCWPAYKFSDFSQSSSVALHSLFRQEVVRGGILTRNGFMISNAHSERDLGNSLDVFESALEVVSKSVKQNSVLTDLEGSMIIPVIREQKEIVRKMDRSL